MIEAAGCAQDAEMTHQAEIAEMHTEMQRLGDLGEFAAAAEVQKQLAALREKGPEPIGRTEMQKLNDELQKNIADENFAGAAAMQQQIVALRNSMRIGIKTIEEKVQTLVAAGDYAGAGQLNQQLNAEKAAISDGHA